MAQIVIKSKDDVAKMPALADGQYTATSTYSADSAKALGSPTAVATLTVSAGGTKYVTVPALDGGDTLDAFKANLSFAFDKGTITQITLDVVPAKDTSTTAPAETPWLLIAGAAVLAYVLLRKK